MATRFSPRGPERQINVPPQQDGVQLDADITAVTDGRFFVAFQDWISATDSDVIGQFVNADGTLSGASIVFGQPSDEQLSTAVAPRITGAGAGGVIVVWEDRSINAGDIELAIVSTAGVNTTAGGELNVVTGTTGAADQQLEADVTTLTDGRSLIVWQRAVSASDHDIHARILDAAGTAFTTVDRIDVDNSAGTFQSAPYVAAGQSNTALVVYQDNSLGNFDIEARFFNGVAFDPAFAVANQADNLTAPDVVALADQRFAIVYAGSTHIFGRIYDPETPDGAFLSAEFQIDQTGVAASFPRLAASVDGGFVVTWIRTGTDFDVLQRRFDAHGLAFGDEFVAATLSDNNQMFPAVAASGANVLTVWDDFGSAGREDTEPRGIRGQAFTTTAFDYNSARFGDFDNNGRDDILFQNDTGDLMLWRTNGSGVLSAIDPIGSLSGAFRVDGTGNFNGTPGDDILLRSPNQVAVLPMSGVAAQPMQVLGGTSPVWLNAGMGDVTGDGQTDLLFRHAFNGEIATWGVANNALTTAPKVLGSTAAAFHIVAVDDFTGDRQSDILFRHDNGDIAIWRVANNALAGVPAVVGSTSTAYHVVATGDFDGNASNDIMFRNDNGDVAMWLLNSAGQLLGAPQLVGNAALELHVEGTGDLNGDNRSDIIFRHADGTIIEWLMNGAALAAPPAVLGIAQVDHAIAAHHFELL